MDSKELIKGIQDYLEQGIHSYILEGSDLPEIAFWGDGFTSDILDGSHPMPASVTMIQSVNHVPFCDECNVSFAVAIRNDDVDALEKWGNEYGDVIRSLLVKDCTLGGICVDTNNIVTNMAGASGLMVVVTEFVCSVYGDGYTG